MHIGISGPIASGKSTLARSLVAVFELMEIKARIVPFAEDLKWMVGLYGKEDIVKLLDRYFRNMGFDSDEIYMGIIQVLYAMMMYPPVDGVKPRKLYQYIGTEAGRYTMDEDIWVDSVKMRINEDTVNRYFISDDMRFANESDAVNFHIAIVVDGESATSAYEARIAGLPADYVVNDHVSEKQQLTSPHYSIPANFTTVEVVDLAKAINHKWRSGHALTTDGAGNVIAVPFIKNRRYTS